MEIAPRRHRRSRTASVYSDRKITISSSVKRRDTPREPRHPSRFEKKRMMPVGAIDTIDHKNRRINVKLTKDEIKRAPDYEAERRDDQVVREDHEDYSKQHAGARR